MDEPSGLGEWRPDPTKRHQLRWWDGSSWSDSVADDGEISSDPMGEDAPRVSTKTVVTSASERRALPRAGIVAGGIAAIIAVAVALIVFKGGGSAEGFGDFTATLDSPTDVDVRTIKVPAKSMVKITATADAGFTPAIVVLTGGGYLAKFDEEADLSDLLDESDLEILTKNADYSEPSDVFKPAESELPKLLRGTDASKFLRPGEVVFNSSAGTLIFAAPVAGEFRIVVGGAGAGAGGIKLKFEHVDIGGGSMKDFFSKFNDSQSSAN